MSPKGFQHRAKKRGERKRPFRFLRGNRPRWFTGEKHQKLNSIWERDHFGGKREETAVVQKKLPDLYSSVKER